MNNKLLASAAKIAANAIIVLGYGLLAYGAYLRFRADGSLNSLGLLIVNAFFIAMYVTRRDASSISRSPLIWLIAFGGTCVPLLLRPTAASEWSLAGNLLQILGIASICASILSLRRSFGIVPANRGVRTQGLYGLVRHPLYASELLWMLGFVIANPSTQNIALWLADCALQFTRACAEERLLSADPAYSSYQARVRYRLIPRVI